MFFANSEHEVAATCEICEVLRPVNFLSCFCLKENFKNVFAIHAPVYHSNDRVYGL